MNDIFISFPLLQLGKPVLTSRGSLGGLALLVVGRLSLPSGMASPGIFGVGSIWFLNDSIKKLKILYTSQFLVRLGSFILSDLRRSVGCSNVTLLYFNFISLVSILPFSLFVTPVSGGPSAATVARIGVVGGSSPFWGGHGPWLVLHWIGVQATAYLFRAYCLPPMVFSLRWGFVLSGFRPPVCRFAISKCPFPHYFRGYRHKLIFSAALSVECGYWTAVVGLLGFRIPFYECHSTLPDRTFHICYIGWLVFVFLPTSLRAEILLVLTLVFHVIFSLQMWLWYA